MTAKFAAAANLPFLLLQLPQIVLNAQNLLAGNKAALFAIPWLVIPQTLKIPDQRFLLLAKMSNFKKCGRAC